MSLFLLFEAAHSQDGQQVRTERLGCLAQMHREHRHTTRAMPTWRWQKRLRCWPWAAAVFMPLCGFGNSSNNDDAIKGSTAGSCLPLEASTACAGIRAKSICTRSCFTRYIWTSLHLIAQPSLSHFLFQWKQLSTLVNKFF